MFEPTGVPRVAAREVADQIDSIPAAEVLARQHAAEQSMRFAGVTFNVYEDLEGTERIFPFDLVPRVVEQAEWH
jgi:uncharacterized circularly permuted ATP-grasp superfamily protein